MHLHEIKTGDDPLASRVRAGMLTQGGPPPSSNRPLGLAIPTHLLLNLHRI
jgi:hypothetical protein